VESELSKLCLSNFVFGKNTTRKSARTWERIQSFDLGKLAHFESEADDCAKAPLAVPMEIGTARNQE
jgi:hypothetical protein